MKCYNLSILRYFFSGALASLMVCPSVAGSLSVSKDLNTGFDQSMNTLIGRSQADDDWMITAVPSQFVPPLTPPPFEAVVVAVNPWSNYRSLNPFPDARWISVNDAGADDLVGGFDPSNDFRFDYVREFQLPVPVARLDFTLQVDDKATEVRLNGNLLASNLTGGETVTTSNPADFQQGTNELKLEVKDGGGVITGLAIQGSVTVQLVPVDIKPQGCPNPLEVNQKGGVLPVAVTGTEDFDVTTIDPDSITLVSENGPQPIRWNIEKVAAPYDPVIDKKEDALDKNEDPCLACTEQNDDIDDLTLKFHKEDVIDALGDVEDGDCVTVDLYGKLKDGTPIFGEDIVKIIEKGGGAVVIESERGRGGRR